jgi:polysaccharide chain length determinant protein (PEP-CTERM system associated)
MDLKFYFSLFLRRLPWFLLLLALGSAIGITLARVLPPVYVAQARLVVESEQIPDSLAASTVQTKATEQLQIIQQRILTRATLLDMANQLAIYGAVEGRAPPQMTAEDIVSDLRKRISIVASGGSAGRGQAAQAQLVSVSFQAPSATLAASVTNQLVTMILQEDVKMRTGVAGQTLDFFQQEVARLDQDLSKRGAAILEFKQKNLTALPDSLDFRRSQQAAAQERLLQLQRDMAALKDRRDRLVQVFNNTGEVEASNQPKTPAETQLKDMQDKLNELLAVFSPENPRVTLLKAQIATQQRRIATQSVNTGAPSGAKPPSAYEIQLSDIDGQMTYLESQKADITATLADLQTSIEATPGNAITLDTLQRDYDNLQTQYNQAVANKARAETGDVIESLSKGQRISIIEQAVAPNEPERPNRSLIVAAGVGGGAAAGLGLIFLLELLNSAIRRPGEVIEKLGITPLGTLPYLRSKQHNTRRRMILILTFALVLIAIPALLWFIDSHVIPLDLLFFKLKAKVGLSALSPVVPKVFG